MEVIEHEGVAYPVPQEVVAEGRDAVARWWAATLEGLAQSPALPQTTEG